jgi:hypothetical protein
MFYSYLYLREDETPYYVGKGCGKRAFKHKKNGDVHPPKDKFRIIIFPMLNEAEAFESEMALIELFGRKDLGTGILYNRTNGGDGTSGLRWSEEAKQKMSEDRLGEKCYWLFGKRGEGTPRFGIRIPHSETTKQKMSRTRKGKKLSEEHRLAIAKGQNTEEYRKRKSIIATERWRAKKAAQEENSHRQ